MESGELAAVPFAPSMALGKQTGEMPLYGHKGHKYLARCMSSLTLLVKREQSGAGGPFDQRMCHLPSLPAAGAARDQDPLLQQRPLQRIPCLLLLSRPLPADPGDAPPYLPPVKQSSEDPKEPGGLSGQAAPDLLFRPS
ncbi:hypothetical protein E2320_006752, partial [Naja naja]